MLVAVALGVAFATAQAQVRPAPATPPGVSSPTIGLGSMRAPTSTGPLDGAVDPRSYIVGPGDVFVVAIGGIVPRQFTATVSASGELVVAELGSVRAAGRTLAAVLAETQTALQRQFRSVPAEVSLATPRTFAVYVSGAVAMPGRHLAGAVSRVEDVIRDALGRDPQGVLAEYGTLPASPEVRRPALRSIEIRRRSAGSQRVDLVRYLATGDLSSNPYLLDGDELHVPTFTPATEGVFVNGDVGRPGIYDTFEGDTVADVVAAAVGDSDTPVRLVRPGATGGPVESVLSPDEQRRTRVQPMDQLTVGAGRPRQGVVEVVGAVRMPGVYPVVIGVTSVAELVALAGGLDDRALARAAYIERPVRADGSRIPTEVGTAAAPAPPVDVAALPGNESALDFLEQRYLSRELARAPRLPVDLSTPPQGALATLRDGDRLVVPNDLGGILVIGQVVQRGFVPFVAGRSAAEYVAAAGGRAAGATGVYVIDAASGVLRPGETIEVEAGDAVFVSREAAGAGVDEEQLLAQQLAREADERRADRREEREERQERRQARYQFIQTVLSTAGVVVSALLAVAALRN